MSGVLNPLTPLVEFGRGLRGQLIDLSVRCHIRGRLIDNLASQARQQSVVLREFSRTGRKPASGVLDEGRLKPRQRRLVGRRYYLGIDGALADAAAIWARRDSPTLRQLRSARVAEFRLAAATAIFVRSPPRMLIVSNPRLTDSSVTLR